MTNNVPAEVERKMGLSRGAKLALAIVGTLMAALLHPLLGVAVSIGCAFLLRPRSHRIILAVMAVVLIGYVLVLTSIFSTGLDHKSTGSVAAAAGPGG